jgi:hypothetical protein
VPYLSSLSGTSRFRRDPRDREIHIGLVWRAGGWDRRRSVDLRLFGALARDEVRLHLLLDLTDEVLPFAADDLACSNISDFAATISQLDLILSVDTMTAHLAGAMGLPVWTMLCHESDWRWGQRSTTPWYPTMRLFRQSTPGDWLGVISEVADALEEIVRRRTQERVHATEVLETKVLTL